MTPRVVLDTNIVVSALLKPQGLEDQVLRLALSGKVEYYTSLAVLAEYALVLPRPKLKLRPCAHPWNWLAPNSVEPHCWSTKNRLIECAWGASHLCRAITRLCLMRPAVGVVGASTVGSFWRRSGVRKQPVPAAIANKGG